MNALRWYLHPWRLLTLLAGTLAILYGAHIGMAPDWDVGVSLLMCGVTYGVMPHFNRELFSGRYVVAFLYADFAVNTTYTIYWSWRENPMADALMNYPASWWIFMLCWAIWSLVPPVFQPLADPLVARKNFAERCR
jgi:hypothetical protein